MSILHVNGIVAVKDKKPYVQIELDNSVIAQMSMAEARSFANDIILQCSRVEADAMIVKFFKSHDLPDGALAALMKDFRDFRFSLDMEPVGKFISDPDTEPEKMQ